MVASHKSKKHPARKECLYIQVIGQATAAYIRPCLPRANLRGGETSLDLVSVKKTVNAWTSFFGTRTLAVTPSSGIQDQSWDDYQNDLSNDDLDLLDRETLSVLNETQEMSYLKTPPTPVSYTHLTLPTNREV